MMSYCLGHLDFANYKESFSTISVKLSNLKPALFFVNSVTDDLRKFYLYRNCPNISNFLSAVISEFLEFKVPPRKQISFCII